MDKIHVTMWSRIVFLAAWLPRRCSWKLISTPLTTVLMSQLLFCPATCSPQSTVPQLSAYSFVSFFVSVLKKHILKRIYNPSLYISQEVIYFTYDVFSNSQFVTFSELVVNEELETTCEKAVAIQFNPLKTNVRLLYLKPQSVPRCKHFSSRL